MKVELKLMLHVAAFVFGSKKQHYNGSIDGTSKRIRKWFEIRMGIKNYGVPRTGDKNIAGEMEIVMGNLLKHTTLWYTNNRRPSYVTQKSKHEDQFDIRLVWYTS